MGHPVRILHVINQVSGRAGAEVSLRDIVTRTTDEFEHAIAPLRATSNVLAPFESAGVPCYPPTTDLTGRVAQVRHVRAAIRAFRPDLVHTALFDADTAGRIAAAITGVPAVTSLVNTPYGTEAVAAEPVNRVKLRGVQVIDRLLATWATSGFHAISDATAEHAVQHLGVRATSIRVVPRGRSRSDLGEPTPERRSRVRSELGWGERPVVLNVAREEPQKGQGFLIDALPTVLAEHPDALLVGVGRRGRSSHLLDARSAELGVAGSVQRLGVRTDVADLLVAADVFAFPSLYEGLGGAVVEAMGLGLPIVASDIPAVREALGSGGGWLVPVRNAAALGAAIGRALEGGSEVERRRRAARDAFDRRFELERCLEGMAGFYRDVETQLGVGAVPGRSRVRLRLSPDRSAAR
jgi:glycosyltransferase involved in cell wall biosynthesis